MRLWAVTLLTIVLGACDAQQSAPTQASPSAPNGAAAIGKETNNEAERLARVWIDYWNAGKPRALPLADSFVHVSPFGRLEGREHYLDTVIPMSERNVTELVVNRLMSSGNQAAIWFDMQTPTGRIPVCDWIIVENGKIAEIHSFYDASTLRYE